MHHLLRCHVQAHQLYLRELRGLEASAKGHSGTVDDTIWLQVVVELHGPEHAETRASRRNLERFQRQHGPID
ncbi:unnamed protein product [Cladocopium goreaui]|uniref:Uncharacterized protein n=1 Tax=Cladocopium goreaui TaxID=2562237 RepID=A0A9P1FNN3_9DINO|nr:unnamed protein product [Cladocopium goreaui]